jgi:hypothetical protein
MRLSRLHKGILEVRKQDEQQSKQPLVIVLHPKKAA